MASQITIKSSDLDKVLGEMLDSISAESIEKMKAATKKAAAFGAKQVKTEAKNIPVGSGDYTHTGLKKTGKYIDSWQYKKTDESALTIEYNIYSKKYYMLTHLLEFGHEKVLWGTRMAGERVRGYPHISIAEKKTEDEFVQFVVTEMERYDSF